MNWYAFVSTNRTLVPPYTETRQELFYAPEGMALKAWQSWPNSRLLAYNAGAGAWVEIHPVITR